MPSNASSPRSREPRLPHERDESSDSQARRDEVPQDETIRRAHDDVVKGRQDTSRGPQADAAYEKQKDRDRSGVPPTDTDAGHDEPRGPK